MQLVSKLAPQDVESIAADMGIQVYDLRDVGIRQRGPHKGRRVLRFTLRPVGSDDTYRLIRSDPYSKSGTRRVWAVSWQGHWDFMVQVFDLDPEAQIKSALAVYDGRDGFYRVAPGTKHRNIGSQIYPQEYGDAAL